MTARLFLYHEPQEAMVTPGSAGTDEDGEAWRAFFVPAADIPLEIDVVYICFVYQGKCWAARNKSFYNGGKNVGFICVPFNDDPSGHLMVLADALLR